MGSRRGPDEWRTAVMRQRGLSGALKLYLTYLADHMRDDRKVSRPRRTVARDLGIGERTVDYRNARAVELGFLYVVTAGRKHMTAVYQGTFPESQSASSPRAEKYQNLRAENSDSTLSDESQSASSCAPVVERNPPHVVTRRDEERSNEEPDPEAVIEGHRPAANDREATA